MALIKKFLSLYKFRFNVNMQSSLRLQNMDGILWVEKTCVGSFLYPKKFIIRIATYFNYRIKEIKMYNSVFKNHYL